MGPLGSGSMSTTGCSAAGSEARNSAVGMNLVGSRLGNDINHPAQRLPILCRVRAGLYAELLDGFGTGARDTAAAGAVRVLENIEVHPAGIGAIHQEVQPAFLPERAR